MQSLAIGLAVAVWLAMPAMRARAAEYDVFFGTQSAGPTKGLSMAHFDSDTGKLTKPEMNVHADAPAYYVFTADGKFLYTCNAIANFGGAQHMGAVSAFAVDPKTKKLTLLNQLPSAGDDPSYISLDKTGRFALVANYNGNKVAGEGGTVAVFSIKPDGSFGERTALDQHKGTSINASRQGQAYAHSIITDPSNKFALSPDLGVDKVYIYRFDEKTGALTPNDPAFVTLKPGSGPRHIVFHPNGKIVYVIQEMGSMITAFTWDGQKGALTPFQEISTLPADFTGTSTCAEIRVSPNEKYVYASNRGHNSIAQLAIDPQTFKLTLLRTVPSGGNTPRNFEFDPTGKWMVVTNHGSNNAVVFSIDPATGQLAQKGDPVAVDYPFCPRFFPLPNP